LSKALISNKILRTLQIALTADAGITAPVVVVGTRIAVVIKRNEELNWAQMASNHILF
jgi:hypothetical protein